MSCISISGSIARCFEPELLQELLQEAPGSVRVEEQSVFIRSLIVQLKIVPLPVYLQSADEAATRAVIQSLGHCIRNNAATNIFNKDLDSRNYGVGRYGRVFLFDYDAVERLTEVKIRTNSEREPGEESVPDWYFEAGVVFLPEEIEYGLQLKSDFARRCFSQSECRPVERNVLGRGAAEVATRRSAGAADLFASR